ncbi:selection and upkeep of intraepithelial T-cells protein 6-like [Periophthalmus magnuspinnatus]|uniref:selection and upkeep of intraepithelial T-cells protein 6-like n=1 Tax=Periophthalmus magnuspinnatus TaxID=409849 RepID=UPI00243687C9|nr:selection and upkeep of intraepithelial T-cells protein 6-like [Periophthalmus magnuspinnatus]
MRKQIFSLDVLQFSVFLLQTHFCWSQNTLVVPSQPIIAPVGSDVTLPCQLDPVKDLRDMVVEWSRHNLTPRYIHIRRDGLDLLMDQNSLYLGRTSVSESRLQQGDMSLSLNQVRLSDRGTYRCYIPQIDTKAEVTLLVVSVAPPSMSLIKERSGSPVLRCESRGWYPEPELEWLDSEGTVLLRTEAQRGASEELFSVSSRLSVEQRLGNTFTCRVRQQESGQSREAQLSITGKKSDSKSTELGEKEERESIMKKEEIINLLKQQDETQRLHLKESVPELKENLEKTETVLRYINDVIKTLTVAKNFLMKLKEDSHKTIDKMNSLIDAQRKRWFQQNTEALETEKMFFVETVELLDNQIKTLEEVISVSLQRKGQFEAERQQMEKQKKRQETKTQQETREEEEKVNVQVNVQVNAHDQPQ